MHRFLSVLVAALALALSGVVAQQGSPSLPEGNLRYGAFTARFAADGTFSLEGQAWPTFTGTWTRDGEIIVLSTEGGRRRALHQDATAPNGRDRCSRCRWSRTSASRGG